MSAYKPYPAYKDSGVEWLGEVPEHWEVVPYKYLARIQNGSDHKHVETEEGFPVIGSGGIFAFASDYLYDGESVLLGRKGTIDKPLYVTGKFWAVDTMYWTKIAPDAHGKFAFYAALTIPFSYYSTNTALPSMTKSTLSAHPVVRPPLPEQTAIAAYLDRETAKIDALIAAQRRLIDLLREKSSALISHAVTKGLNPDAPMKESGVPWLGKVPEGWEVRRLKHFASYNDDVLPELTDPATEIDYVDISSVSSDNGIENVVTVPFSSAPSRARRLVKVGDVIVSTVRTYLKAIAPINAPHQNIVVSTGFVVIRPGEGFEPSFARYSLHSNYFMDRVVAGSVGVSYPAINAFDLISIEIAAPAAPEQSSIAAFLDRETSKIDALIAKTEKAIELAKERRSALISAAVTGKIDVREAA